MVGNKPVGRPIIEDIWEQVKYEWEEYLNKELDNGKLQALDIEGVVYLDKFLAKYKLSRTDKYAPEGLTEVVDDFLGFFDRFYAVSTEDAWLEYLTDNIPIITEGMDPVPDDFLFEYGVNRSAITPEIREKLKQILDHPSRGY